MRRCLLLSMLAGKLWGCSLSHPAVINQEVPKVGELKVEQLGGLAGFGGPHLKSWGVVDLSSLSQVDRVAVEALFERNKRTPVPLEGPAQSDQFHYRLTRGTPTGSETVEALESELPEVLKASVSARVE
jgi:hypothetical protein